MYEMLMRDDKIVWEVYVSSTKLEREKRVQLKQLKDRLLLKRLIS